MVAIPTTTFGHRAAFSALDRLLTYSARCPPLFFMTKNKKQNDLIEKIMSLSATELPALLACLLPNMKDLAKNVKKNVETPKQKK